MTGDLSSERGEEKEPPPSERPPRAFSLPTREPGDELDSNRLLDWLRTGEEQPEGGADEDTAAEQAAVVDDWLSELSDIEPSGGVSGEDLSDWFQDEAVTAEDDGTAEFADWLLESEGSLSEESGLMDWLADLDTDEEVEDEEETIPGEILQEEPESFVTGEEDTLIAPSPFDQSEETLPEWLSDFGDREEVKQEEEEALPDWLSDYDSGGETEPVEAAEEEALPDWLSDYEPEGGEVEPAEDEALSDWLNDFNAEEETPTLISSFEQPDDTDAAEDEALPDWLNDFDTGEETPTLISSFEQPDGTDAAEEETALGWLDDFDTEEETPTLIDAFEEPAGEDELLDWLNDFDSEKDESAPAAMAEDVLPDWLSELDDDEESAPEIGFTGLLDEAFKEADGGDEESAMPDWMAEMPSPGSGFETTLEDEEDTAHTFIDFDAADYNERPDWLADVAPVEEPPLEELAEAADEETADEETAGWLTDFSDEDESLDSPEDTDWLTALTQEEIWPEVPEEEEIVAQLDELEEEEPDESAGHSKELKGVPKELAGSDLPDWLQDDMPEFEYESEEEGQDLFGDDELVQESLPDWLQQMKPAELEQRAQDSDLEADFALAETRDEWQNILENMPAASPEEMPGAGTLSAAEIPAWLQSLRPREYGEVIEPSETDEPPETEGPLAGMRGVLPMAPAIVKPVAAVEPARYTISKEQQQQISLLHQLTHEEPAQTKQVSQRKATAFSGVWRIVLGILLFLVVAAGVLLPELGIGLPETTLPVPQSALDSYRVIDNISGRTVLVAFEYTPAMGGELDPIALMLLRHLAENDNRVLTISQSAAGTAVAGQITAEVSDLENSAFGLLPGEAVGLRGLGSCLNSADDCGLLLGTEPDAALQGELADVGLVIILTSDRNSLVNWIEQVEAHNEIPVIAAVTQSLGPLAIPYLSSGQLEGSLTGIPAASAYEKVLRGQDGRAFEAFSAQTIVMWVVVVALVGAALFYGLTGFAGRGQKKGSG